MIARTAGGLGIVALLLAVSGLYSVIAFFVALRTSEFGIRLALGARSADIVRMVLGQALRLAGIGLAVGAVLGMPLLIALHANFPFTERFDPAVILPAGPRARPDRPFRGMGAGSQSVLDSGVGGPPGRLARFCAVKSFWRKLRLVLLAVVALLVAAARESGDTTGSRRSAPGEAGC